MGQRVRVANRSAGAVPVCPLLSVFSTDLGWIGILGCAGQLHAVTIGHDTGDGVRDAIHRRLSDSSTDDAGVDFPTEGDWFPALRRRLQEYCAGHGVDFADIPLQVHHQTVFQKRVLELTRRIAFGRTITYGALALQAGFPRAARAVGTVMSTNRFPLVVPCHRVVQSGGRIGNYTAPQGRSLKERLLALEAAVQETAAK